MVNLSRKNMEDPGKTHAQKPCLSGASRCCSRSREIGNHGVCDGFQTSEFGIMAFAMVFGTSEFGPVGDGFRTSEFEDHGFCELLEPANRNHGSEFGDYGICNAFWN